MATNQYYTPTDKAGTFARIKGIYYALCETTISTDRRAWFDKTLAEFRYLLNIANAYTFSDYQQTVINHGADAFNEAALFFLGVTIDNPRLHYAA